MNHIIETASSISTPLALSGLIAAVYLLLIRKILSLPIFVKLTRKDTAKVVNKTLNHLLLILLATVAIGFTGYVLALPSKTESNYNPDEPNNHPQLAFTQEIRRDREHTNPVPTFDENSYNNLLFAATQELQSNREYTNSVRCYMANKNIPRPIGSIQAENTLNLFNKHYNKLTRFAYGEEKYIYQLAVKLQKIGSLFSGFKSREDYRNWNTTYEFTIDDVSFLCGFLSWYLAHVAQEDLESSQLRALGCFATSSRFATDQESKNLDMRFFSHNDKPFCDYPDYLGLID